MTSICDERGQELIYAGMPITEVFKSEIGLGGTLGLLWFQRRCVLLFVLKIAMFLSLFTTSTSHNYSVLNDFHVHIAGCRAMHVSSSRCV